MAGNLTPKQAIFIAEYLVDLNGTRAAIAAGVPATSAAVTASRWLKAKKIADAIEEQRERRRKRLEISADHVLEEIAKLAFFDPRDLYDANGNLKPIAELDDVTAAAIAGLEVERKQWEVAGGIVGTGASITKKLKLADKGQNLERLGRHLKLFTDLHEHKGRLTLEQLVAGDDGQSEGSGGEAAA